MNIIENLKNEVNIIERKSSLFIYKISHILAAIYPKPMDMVPNLSLGSGLSSDLSHYLSCI